MKSYPNIEHLPGKQHYTGYANGVWFITKSNSSYGNWCARYRDDTKVSPIFAYTLREMSDKLAIEAKKEV